MSEQKSNSVEAAKWDWKAGGGLPPPPKPPMKTSVKAVIQSLVMTGVGLLFFFVWHHRVGPVIIWSFAAVILFTGLFVEPANRAIERFFAVHFAKWVGTALTWILMVPVYLLVFTPAHLILKLRGLDPLARKFPTDLPTYWIPRKPVTVEQYKRQH